MRYVWRLFPVLFLVGCEGEAASRFWDAMGMLLVGLMVFGALILLLEVIAAVMVLLFLAAELLVLILNIARPRPVTAVSGLVMGALNACSGIAGLVLWQINSQVDPTTLTTPPDPDASTLALAGAAFGVLSGAALGGSGVYAWMRLRKQVADPFTAG